MRRSPERAVGEASVSNDATEPVGLATAGLEAWLRERRPDLVGAGSLTARLLTGGRSNLTYRVDGGPHPFVLRRPPLGHVLSTAHDMAREFRVVTALAPTPVPVPGTFLHHDDADGTAGVGAPFFLMEHVDGRVLADPEDNAGIDPAHLRVLSTDLADVLARLHEVDPASVGLSDHGRPEGFLDRQVRRWGIQYDRSRSRELPGLDRLQEVLRRDVPATVHVALLHGDYRLDNAIVRPAPDGLHVAAILDWEMSTLGDACTDLGLLGLYWGIGSLVPAAGATSAVVPGSGYASFDELVDAYSVARGIAVPDLAWYSAFAAYKLAIILEGIHFRYRGGQTVGAGFETVGSLVAPLAHEGLRHLGAATART